MADSGSDDNEWQPPTEAELKILQARRERSDKISKLMGAYLLKGYKMLGTNCVTCGCILMQDKQKQNYCIACSELDTDTGKDDPVVSEHAARRQVLEDRQRQPCSTSLSMGSPEPSPTPMQGSMEPAWSMGPARLSGCQDNNANVSTSRPRELAMAAAPPATIGNAVTPLGVDVSYPLRVLHAKMLQATQDLESAGSMETSIQLCQLIKACAETMATLHKCNHTNPSPS